jgi:hypothetical protein
MNLRRGLRRITFVLAIVSAIFCAFCAVVLILDEHDSAQSYLRWKQDNFLEKYRVLPPPEGFVIDEPKKEDEHKPLTFDPNLLPKLPTLKRGGKKYHLTFDPNLLTVIDEPKKKIAEEELRELKNSFWVNLSKHGLIGLCILTGLGGAAVGFFGTWLVVWFGGLAIYKLIRWVVLGFHDSQDKDVRGKSKEAT